METLLLVTLFMLTFGNCNALAKSVADTSEKLSAESSTKKLQSDSKSVPADKLGVRRLALYRNSPCEGAGHELAGTVVTMLTAVTEAHLCAIYCIMHKTCGSFNFDPGNDKKYHIASIVCT